MSDVESFIDGDKALRNGIVSSIRSKKLKENLDKFYLDFDYFVEQILRKNVSEIKKEKVLGARAEIIKKRDKLVELIDSIL